MLNVCEQRTKRAVGEGSGRLPCVAITMPLRKRTKTSPIAAENPFFGLTMTLMEFFHICLILPDFCRNLGLNGNWTEMLRQQNCGDVHLFCPSHYSV